MILPKYTTKTTETEVQIWRDEEHVVSVKIEDFQDVEQAEFYATESMQMVVFGETMGARSLFEFIDSLDDKKAYLVKQLKDIASDLFNDSVEYSIQGNNDQVVVLRKEEQAFTVEVEHFESLEDAVQFARQSLEFVNYGEIIGVRAISKMLEELDDNKPYTSDKLIEIAKVELKEKYGDAIAIDE